MTATSSDDFESYLKDGARQSAEAERVASMLHEHEIWRQQTWAGFTVRQLQKVGNHFQPFFIKLTEIMSGQPKKNPTEAIILMLLIRILQVAALIGSMYALGRILGMVVGRNIVIEQEVIIEHEVGEDETEIIGLSGGSNSRDLKDKKNT